MMYCELFFFFGVCGLCLVAAKCYALWIEHDDLRWHYFVYFVIFAMNFTSNSVLFVLRIFERGSTALGIVAIAALICFRIAFDLSLSIHSQAVWTKPAFLTKRVTEWLSVHRIAFAALSVVAGPVGAICFVNSRLFPKEVFFMAVPESNITHFVGSVFWAILSLQKVPEIALQIAFVAAVDAFDVFVFWAVMSSLASLAVVYWMRCGAAPIASAHKFHIQRTAFLIEVASPEINGDPNRYALRPNALRMAIARILGIADESHLVEFPLFEAIRLSDAKCYGLKLFVAINSHWMSRREILIKFQSARRSNAMANALRTAWSLSTAPSIDDIVMVYDLGGDLVIQRPLDPDEADLESEVEWTGSSELDGLCGAVDGRPDLTRRRCKKSSFTLDGSAPFDCDRREKSPYLPSRSALHIENAPSFTLDLLDENDPFEQWDAGSTLSPYLGDLERKMSLSMDAATRKRWKREPTKLRVAELSSTVRTLSVAEHSSAGDEEKVLRFHVEMNRIPGEGQEAPSGMARVISL